MKPSEWNEWNTNEKREYALALRSTMRGKLIAGQALAKAVLVMREAEYPETSNIEDMETIGLLYEPWFTYYLNEKEVTEVAMTMLLAVKTEKSKQMAVLVCANTPKEAVDEVRRYLKGIADLYKSNADFAKPREQKLELARYRAIQSVYESLAETMIIARPK